MGQVGAKLASVSILRGPRGALGGTQTFTMMKMMMVMMVMKR